MSLIGLITRDASGVTAYTSDAMTSPRLVWAGAVSAFTLVLDVSVRRRALVMRIGPLFIGVLYKVSLFSTIGLSELECYTLESCRRYVRVLYWLW